MQRIITSNHFQRARIVCVYAASESGWPQIWNDAGEEERMSTKKAKLSKGKKLEAQKPLRDISTIPVTKNTDVGSAK
jgi:hypothetical protein